MQFSFIHPRKKEILSAEFRLMLFFFGVTMTMLILAYLFLVFKSYAYESDFKDSKQEISELNLQTKEINSDIDFVTMQKIKADEIFTTNTLMRDSMQNLFDLVPDKITVASVKMEKKSLVLYGISPNKEVYEYLLLAPLRSIFHHSYTTFYTMDNGWIHFVSTNYLDVEDGPK